MVGRPRKVIQYPNGLKFLQAVKVTNSNDFKGPKLGLITGMCKDGGVTVKLTAKNPDGIARYTCIHEERGNTIEGIEIESNPKPTV